MTKDIKYKTERKAFRIPNKKSSVSVGVRVENKTNHDAHRKSGWIICSVPTQRRYHAQVAAQKYLPTKVKTSCLKLVPKLLDFPSIQRRHVGMSLVEHFPEGFVLREKMTSHERTRAA